MEKMTLLMLGMLAVAPYACSAPTDAEPVGISLSPRLEKWQQFVAEANGRFGIPRAWIYAVMSAESAGQATVNDRPIVSRAGAMGLMQVMPATYEDMRAEYGLGPDPQDPRDNILAGTAYLRAMYDRFGFPGLFAAYNAGPGRYEAYRQGQRRLPAETVAYLKKLKAAGVSAADIDRVRDKSVQGKSPKNSSERELFFVKDGVSAKKPTGEILVPIGPRRLGSEQRN